MGANKHKDHLVIIPEDNAYGEMAEGFVGYQLLNANRVDILRPANGWASLVDKFQKYYAAGVRQYTHRHVLLLFDADKDQARLGEVLAGIPGDIRARVFALCCLDESEALKRALGGGYFKEIGRALAESCDRETYGDGGSPWQCPELRHNQDELARLAAAVRPFIFTKEA